MKVGLALGSGGVRGFAHLGVLEVLEREGIPIDIIVGSSAGAAVGAMYAFRPKLAPNLTHIQHYLQSDLYGDARLNYLKQAEESRDSFYDAMRVRFAKGAVFAASMTRPSLFDIETLRSNVSFLVDPVNIEDSLIKLGVVSFDISTGEELLIDHGLLTDAIMASCAIPGVFPSVVIDEHQLMDGGVTNPVPCDHVRNMGADLVVGIDVTPQLAPLASLSNSYEAAIRASDISRFRLKQLQLRDADIVISVEASDVFWGDFSSFERVVELGREAADRALPQLRSVLNQQDN